MEYGVKSHVGKVRSKNEDSYLALKEDGFIMAVADGMGGHRSGEVASSIAIDTIRHYQGQREDIRKMLGDIIFTANQNVIQRQKENPDCKGMGTTLTIAQVVDDLLYIGHVGDSRAYLYRNQDLLQITTDHSLVNELVKTDQITEKEARNHPQKNIVLQALGSDKELDPEISCISLEESDMILLCTDGLTDMLTDEEICQVVGGKDSLQEKVDILVEQANEKGGLDNITVVLHQDQF